MSKKEKNKDKKNDCNKESKKDSKKLKRKLLQKSLGIAENCKAECCKKYKKSEDKRCKLCPMFDLLKRLKH